MNCTDTAKNIMRHRSDSGFSVVVVFLHPDVPRFYSICQIEMNRDRS